jgi:hypothetical protein
MMWCKVGQLGRRKRIDMEYMTCENGRRQDFWVPFVSTRHFNGYKYEVVLNWNWWYSLICSWHLWGSTQDFSFGHLIFTPLYPEYCVKPSYEYPMRSTHLCIYMCVQELKLLTRNWHLGKSILCVITRLIRTTARYETNTDWNPVSYQAYLIAVRYTITSYSVFQSESVRETRLHVPLCLPLECIYLLGGNLSERVMFKNQLSSQR